MIIPTKTPIDELTGGLYYGRVTLIYGPTGCGKTTLAIAASRGLLESGRFDKVVYIDTEEGVPEGLNRGIEVKRVYSLKEQKDLLKELAKSSLERVVVVVDTLTGHFHREVLRAPKEFRASVAGDLSGKLIDQLTLLRKIVGQNRGIGLVTAHLRSPVSDAFRLNVLRKIAKAYKDGRYVPTATDYERYMAYDPVRWIGGQGLGMHTQYRFRIYVDEDRSRIIQVEKWPAYPIMPNWCVRYRVAEDGSFQTVDKRFTMDSQTKSRLFALEFKTILGEVLELSEKEGIEIGEAEEKESEEKKQRRPRKPRPSEVKLPKIPSLGEIAEKEKVRGGDAGESGDSGSHGEGAGGRQE
jgi:DNA polymerase III delta prime subunit